MVCPQGRSAWPHHHCTTRTGSRRGTSNFKDGSKALLKLAASNLLVTSDLQSTSDDLKPTSSGLQSTSDIDGIRLRVSHFQIDILE